MSTASGEPNMKRRAGEGADKTFRRAFDSVKGKHVQPPLGRRKHRRAPRILPGRKVQCVITDDSGLLAAFAEEMACVRVLEAKPLVGPVLGLEVLPAG